MSEEVISIIVNYLPVVLALLSEIGVVAGVIVKIREATNNIFAKTDEIVQSNDFTDLRNQMQVVIQENIKLKEQISQMINKIDKIDHEEE